MLKGGSPVHLNRSLAKQPSSEKQTNHPTTSKKPPPPSLQFQRSNPRLHPREFSLAPKQRVRSLSLTIMHLQMRKRRCIQSRRYSRAEAIDKSIKRAQTQLNQVRVEQLIEQQQEERRSISQAHKSEMKHLKRVWNQYFYNLREREAQIYKCFRQQQQNQIIHSHVKLRRRCRSLHNTTHEIIELQNKEDLLRRNEDYQHLKFVKAQLAQAVIKQRRRRSKIIDRFTEMQQERLSITQSKKYSVLVSRLEQYRKDKERVYLREQKRLKQKYKNVMHRLEHEQKVELDQIVKMAMILQY